VKRAPNAFNANVAKNELAQGVWEARDRGFAAISGRPERPDKTRDQAFVGVNGAFSAHWTDLLVFYYF
jgi:hypothetical protein